jgi:hypothetical protein
MSVGRAFLERDEIHMWGSRKAALHAKLGAFMLAVRIEFVLHRFD